MASTDALYHSFHSLTDRDLFLDSEPCSQIAAFNNPASTASSNNEALHSSFSHVVSSDDIQFSPDTAYNICSLVQQEDSFMLLSHLDTAPASSVFNDTVGNTICDVWSLLSEPALQLDGPTHKPDTPNEISFQEDFLLIPPPQSPPPLPPLDTIRARSTPFTTANNIYSTPGRLKHHIYKYFAKKPSKFLKKPFLSSSSSKREELQRNIHLKPVCNSTSLIAGLKKNSAKVDNILLRMSKNSTSERKRRKLFNDKLYSLRALVPKISKMDKASIVRDALEHVQDLQKQVALKQQEISSLQSRLQAGGPRARTKIKRHQPSSKRHPSHKVLKMDVVKMEEGKYYLRIECTKGKRELVQLSKALEALHFDILSANYVSIGGCSLNTLVLQANILNSRELKEMILDIFPKFDLSFIRERG